MASHSRGSAEGVIGPFEIRKWRPIVGVALRAINESQLPSIPLGMVCLPPVGQCLHSEP